MRKRIPVREYRSSVSPKGQITLPIAWREELGIKPGDQVSLCRNEDGIVLKKAPTYRDSFMAIPALGTPLTVEQMTEIAADEAAQEVIRGMA